MAGPAHCLASYLHNSDIPALETKVSLDFQLWHGSEYRQYKRCSSDMIDSYLLLHFDQDRGFISGKEKKTLLVLLSSATHLNVVVRLIFLSL